ncbi:FMN-dependent NADH-azoreductase [Proteus hauseri ATCC 700826]|uniref:FMN-dependent NADH-azoreductase n=1 Tax=Proteus hauseri ATCC 700826 TaxID=1354271 RepID=A0AAJ3HRN8_PROHU|nr:hypothetical protein [Proteus hauseri]OAT46549.1 FMN-dependent NADH-azoreductase [Proteus hauseri ATCC 700826]
MKKILLLKSSILDNGSYSNKMANYLIENWQVTNPNDPFTIRKLVKNPVPIFNQAVIFLSGKDTSILSNEQKRQECYLKN